MWIQCSLTKQNHTTWNGYYKDTLFSNAIFLKLIVSTYDCQISFNSEPSISTILKWDCECLSSVSVCHWRTQKCTGLIEFKLFTKWKIYSGITKVLRHFYIFTPFKDGCHFYDVIITKSYLLITVIKFVSINPNETSLYNYSFLLLYIFRGPRVGFRGIPYYFVHNKK